MTELTDSRLLEAKLLLRPDEVARILRVSRRTVYYLCSRCIVESIRVKGSLRIKAESVRALIEAE